MNDKQPHEKRQHPEGRQVEMKALGQARKIGVFPGLDQPKRIARDLAQRVLARGFEKEPRQAAGAI